MKLRLTIFLICLMLNNFNYSEVIFKILTRNLSQVPALLKYFVGHREGNLITIYYKEPGLNYSENFTIRQALDSFMQTGKLEFKFPYRKNYARFGMFEIKLFNHVGQTLFIGPPRDQFDDANKNLIFLISLPIIKQDRTLGCLHNEVHIRGQHAEFPGLCIQVIKEPKLEPEISQPEMKSAAASSALITVPTAATGTGTTPSASGTGTVMTAAQEESFRRRRSESESEESEELEGPTKKKPKTSKSDKDEKSKDK